jgi:hypothetical protein
LAWLFSGAPKRAAKKVAQDKYAKNEGCDRIPIFSRFRSWGIFLGDQPLGSAPRLSGENR